MLRNSRSSRTTPVGRLILLHLVDPVSALREAAARVRPGGLVIMHECDLGYLWASPQPPLWVVTRQEVDAPTLAGRLLAEVVDGDGCVICPPFTGAWAVRP